MRHLKFITYLAPGLPLPLFAAITEYLADELSVTTTLTVDSRSSGPRPGEYDPFAGGGVDLGWLCTPSYLWSRDEEFPSMGLVPAGLVFDDPRNDGQPHYYSDVVVPRDHHARSFEDLRGGRWVYNDSSSQSGYFNLLDRLSEISESLDFFREIEASGSHLESILSVARGEADAAAIDSNVLAHGTASHPELRDAVRPLESWGPHAIQPLVASSRLDEEVVQRVAEALHRMHEFPSWAEKFRELGVTRFALVSDELYAAERLSLSRGENLLRRCGEALPLPPHRSS